MGSYANLWTPRRSTHLYGASTVPHTNMNKKRFPFAPATLFAGGAYAAD